MHEKIEIISFQVGIIECLQEKRFKFMNYAIHKGSERFCHETEDSSRTEQINFKAL